MRIPTANNTTRGSQSRLCKMLGESVSVGDCWTFVKPSKTEPNNEDSTLGLLLGSGSISW